MSVIPAAVVVFVAMRFAIWVGYRRNPLCRAFGMAGTLYLNLLLFISAAWEDWRRSSRFAWQGYILRVACDGCGPAIEANAVETMVDLNRRHA